MHSAFRLYHTIRYLRPKQVWYQARKRLIRPRLVTEAHPVDTVAKIELCPVIPRARLYLDDNTFSFLNSTRNLGYPIDWSAADAPLLWRYNLQYFDYLLQHRMSWAGGLGLIRDWIAHQPAHFGGVAWEPYPTSLRIVNWLKFMAAHRQFPEEVLGTVALQASSLARRIEYHLLGNHLLANGKALWFAGAFLQRQEWLELGRRIILRELDEQFLPDGGHFELSPMYHALALEDLLDILNLAEATGDQRSRELLHRRTARALGWLQQIVSPDGRLPLLNDSSAGMAASYSELESYATRLHVTADTSLKTAEFKFGWKGRNCSGYWVMNNRAIRLIFDTAPLGADYLPGHAHCDMLAVLLSYKGAPVFEDTGVYEYAEGPRRVWSRTTNAHNTVVLDDLEQADIWKSFRMGRRGHPQAFRVDKSSISCEHDGFCRNGRDITHRRRLVFRPDGVEIEDELRGAGEHRFCSRFHFAPGAEPLMAGESQWKVGELNIEASGGSTRLATTEYFPAFGCVEQRKSLEISGSFTDGHQLRLRCTYSS